MSDQLQVALAEILNKTVEATGKATDFLVAEIPDVLQQLLIWKAAYSVFISVFGVLSVVVSLVAMRITWIKLDAMYEKEKARGGYCENIAPLAFIWVLGMLPMLGFNLVWLQIWLAPKVFLLEYAASLAK